MVASSVAVVEEAVEVITPTVYIKTQIILVV